MADKKISALTAATTPLDGTEVLPIVQSGATKKVANNDLRPRQIQSNATSGVLQIVGPAAAATRVMTTPDANFTAARTDAANSFSGNQTLSDGNLVVGTAGKGITTGGVTALGLGVNSTVDAVTIDISKRLLVGLTSSLTAGGNAQWGRFQIVGNAFSATGPAIIALGRGEAAADIAANEVLGVITFSDNAGNTFASISSDADAAAVRRDPAMLDAVKPLGVVDWYRYGPAMWGATGPRYRDIPRDVRAALTAAIAE